MPTRCRRSRRSCLCRSPGKLPGEVRISMDLQTGLPVRTYGSFPPLAGRGLPARVFEGLLRSGDGILGETSHPPFFLRNGQPVLSDASGVRHTSLLNHSAASQPPSRREPWGTTAATWHGSSANPGPLSRTLTMPQWPSSRRFHVRRIPGKTPLISRGCLTVVVLVCACLLSPSGLFWTCRRAARSVHGERQQAPSRGEGEWSPSTASDQIRPPARKGQVEREAISQQTGRTDARRRRTGRHSPTPSGDTAPRPVTTTRRMASSRADGALACGRERMLERNRRRTRGRREGKVCTTSRRACRQRARGGPRPSRRLSITVPLTSRMAGLWSLWEARRRARPADGIYMDI